MSDDFFTYIYVLAGAETLDLVNHVKKKAEKAHESLKAFADRHGATLGYTDTGMPVFAFETEPPDNWLKDEYYGELLGLPGTSYRPDRAKPEGKALNEEISNYIIETAEQYQFHQLCLELSYEYAKHRHLDQEQTYKFYEFGDNIIVRCPMTDRGDQENGRIFYIPPGSTKISFLDYIKMKLEAEQEPKNQIKTFEYKLQP